MPALQIRPSRYLARAFYISRPITLALPLSLYHSISSRALSPALSLCVFRSPTVSRLAPAATSRPSCRTSMRAHRRPINCRHVCGGRGVAASMAGMVGTSRFSGAMWAKSTSRGFEPLRAEPNGFLVHHLNHSVTMSVARFLAGPYSNAWHTSWGAFQGRTVGIFGRRPRKRAPPAKNAPRPEGRRRYGRSGLHRRVCDQVKVPTAASVCGLHRPRGPMDKASAYRAGDCRFESCRGHCCCRAATQCPKTGIAPRHLQTAASSGSTGSTIATL